MSNNLSNWPILIDHQDTFILYFADTSIIPDVLPEKIKRKIVHVLCTEGVHIDKTSMYNVLSSIEMDELTIYGGTFPESLIGVQTKKLVFGGEKYGIFKLPILPRVLEKLWVGSSYNVFPAYNENIYKHCSLLKKYKGVRPHHYLEYDRESDMELCEKFILFVKQNQ